MYQENKNEIAISLRKLEIAIILFFFSNHYILWALVDSMRPFQSQVLGCICGYSCHITHHNPPPWHSQAIIAGHYEVEKEIISKTKNQLCCSITFCVCQCMPCHFYRMNTFKVLKVIQPLQPPKQTHLLSRHHFCHLVQHVY